MADTFELELDTEELRTLTTVTARPAATGSSRLAVRLRPVLSASAAAILLVIAGTRVTREENHLTASVTATAAPIEREAVLPEAPPVRFANPFDATEIFEFPAGTTRAEARDAVAKFLTERARERFRSMTAKRLGRRHPISPHTANATRLSADTRSLPKRD